MKTLSKLKISSIIAVTSLGLFLLAFFYYKSESGQIIKEKHEFLDAVTNIKLEQIVDWRKERISEAKFFSTVGRVIKYTAALKISKNDREAQNYFSNALSQFIKNSYVENIFIANTNGEILFTLDSTFITNEQVRIEEIKYAIEKDSIIIGDLYICKIKKTIHFNIISIVKDNYGIPIGVFVQQIDPFKSVFNLIQKWSTLNKSVETLLFKKEKDHIIYLNELRHKKNSALRLQVSLSQKEIVSVKAALGAGGIFEGKDYRGVDVLAVVRKVPGSNWFIVSKIDKDELNSEIFYRAGIISLVALVILLLTTLTALYIYKLQQSNIYKNLFLKEKELSETQKVLQRIINLLPIRVFWKDKNLEYLGCNEIFATDAGLKNSSEIIGKNDFQLAWKNEAEFYRADDKLVILNGNSKLNFEESQTTPTGNKIWLKTSKVPLTDKQNNIIGVLGAYEDITAQKLTNEKISDQIKELQRWHNVMLGREDRIRDLKKEVNDLLQKLDLPVRYKID